VSKAKRTEREQRWTLIAVAFIVLLAAAGGFVILKLLPERLLSDPYVVIVLLVAGFVSVTLLLYLGTIILRTAGLGTRGEALGMPEGSIRALIAMSLVLIFAIIGVTVLYSGLGGETIESKGITSAELERLENVQIIAISVVDPAASPGTERFNVTARSELSQAGHDFGLQLLSTVSTLVVAVAGFYFGSRSVAQATKTSNEAAAAALAASAQVAAAAAGTAARGTTTPAGDELGDDDIIGTVEDADGTVEDADGAIDGADAGIEAGGDQTVADAAAAEAAAETEAADAAADAEAEAAEATDAGAEVGDADAGADAGATDRPQKKKP
jgi:hypothetical protein